MTATVIMFSVPTMSYLEVADAKRWSWTRIGALAPATLIIFVKEPFASNIDHLSKSVIFFLP
jgi:hypothetical protein